MILSLTIFSAMLGLSILFPIIGPLARKLGAALLWTLVARPKVRLPAALPQG